jgi:hypothetical protein
MNGHAGAVVFSSKGDCNEENLLHLEPEQSGTP